MKHKTLATLSFAALTAAGLCAWQFQAKLPPPFATPSANNRPQVIERPDGARLTVPQGFTIEEYATGFQRPRYMTLGPSGEILLADSMNSGTIYALIDRNKDGKIDEKKELVKGLDRPYGLTLVKEWLYIAETTSVKRYRYNARTMNAGPGEEILSMKDYSTGHWTRSLLLDRKGEHLFVGIGSKSNVDSGEPAERAAILRISLDGKQKEIYAAGTRNPIGLRLYPGTDQLWAAVQERDGLGDDLVPDYFTSIKQGGFYGWPYAYIGPNEDPRRKGEKPDLVAKTIKPDVLMGSHVAVLDCLFYTGKSFPVDYQGGAFVAQHGSWNRSKRTGYNVAFVPFKDGKPAGPPKEFLGGWMLNEDRREVWGRPVGLLQLPDGSLLVSEDGGNKLWRIYYKG